jgi:HD-like signal output (HDOD) protein
MMRAALLPVPSSLPPQDGAATLALLWERVRQQGDMPGFGSAIGAILGAMRGEQTEQFSITRAVLSDPVLTQKVLRLANSGMYAAFGQRINTVSKAVLVLGTEAIGHLALGLKLVEDLAHGETPCSAHVEMEKAVLAGMVARQVCGSACGRDTEEAVVCSMLHSLGRMMAAFYLPERWEALQDEHIDTAASALLGLTMEELGRATAGHWGLPDSVVGSMRRIDPCAPGDSFSDDDWLAALSTMSTRCADSLWQDDAAGAVTLRALASSFSPMLGVAPDDIVAAIDHARAAAAANLSICPLAKPAEKRARAMASIRLRAEGNKVLLAGVSDMQDVVAIASPNQMMSMALETVYQGLSLSRAVAFLRNRREARYFAKMGLGEDVTALLPALAFGDAYQPTVFHAALGSDRVIFIANARDPGFAAKLPAWWTASLSNARSFVVLPLCANGQPIGFIYGDWDESFPSIELNQTEFALLNDLRALMVRTVVRRQQQAQGGGA